MTKLQVELFIFREPGFAETAIRMEIQVAGGLLNHVCGKEFYSSIGPILEEQKTERRKTKGKWVRNKEIKKKKKVWWCEDNDDDEEKEKEGK